MLKIIAIAAFVALIAAGCYIASAQSERVWPGGNHNETVRLTVGEYIGGAVDYGDWCDHTNGFTHNRRPGYWLPDSQYLGQLTGLHWDPHHRVANTDTKALYGVPVRATEVTITASYDCNHAELGTLAHRTEIRVVITGDESRIPQYVRDTWVDHYWQDLPHPTHAAEIDVLETRTAGQATTIAEQRIAIATVTSRVNAFLQPTVAAQATRIVEVDAIAKDGRDKASGNQRELKTLRDRVTALEPSE